MTTTKNITHSALSTEQLRELAEKYPWWGAAKVALLNRGEKIEGSVLYAMRLRERQEPTHTLLKEVSAEELHRSPMLGIIDDFLREGEHRIVIDDNTTDAPIESASETDEELEEEFVSEELAEIYAKQHLFDLAIEIYQKLSLQNSQKSIYFAEIIDRLKQERSEQDKK